MKGIGGRMRVIQVICLLAFTMMAGCSSREGSVRMVREELRRRDVGFDLVGLKQATSKPDADGAYLFEEAGFFSDLDDAAFLELLQHAAHTGNYGLYRVLDRRQREAQFAAEKLESSLDRAIRNRDAEMARLLIRHGARPGPDSLLQSAYANSLSLTRLLIDQGASFASKDNARALYIAARIGNIESVRAFVESPGTPKEMVADAILGAALTEKIEVVKYLVEHGSDINQEDGDGCIPLHYLAQDGTVEMVRYLLEHGAHINKTCRGRQTPLRWAHYGNNQDVIDDLIAHGATQ